MLYLVLFWACQVQVDSKFTEPFENLYNKEWTIVSKYRVYLNLDKILFDIYGHMYVDYDIH